MLRFRSLVFFNDLVAGEREVAVKAVADLPDAMVEFASELESMIV